MSIQETYLLEIANAIRFAEGSGGVIPAKSFAARIRALSSGSGGSTSYDLQSKTATPGASQQIILPDSGYYGLASVTVAPIPSNLKDVSGVTAGASDVLDGKQIVDASGNVLIGSMVNRGAITAEVPGGDTFIIPEGYHNGQGKVTSLGGGGSSAPAVIQPLSISQNGTYEAPSGVDGYSPIRVNVVSPTAEPVVRELSVSQNGTYTPEEGVDGFAPVVVEVPPPVLESLEVTENGTYTPPDGVDGFSQVVVNTPVGGDGFLICEDIPRVVDCGDIYGYLDR